MDVTCERCGTEYEFDETLLSGRGTSVKCTNCGHVFKVYPQAEADADRTTSVWRLRLEDESIDMIDSLRELQRRISSGELKPENEISRGDESWKSLGSIPELETFFRAAGVEVETAKIPSPVPPSPGSPPSEPPLERAKESSLPPGRRERQPTLLGVMPMDKMMPAPDTGTVGAIAEPVAEAASTSGPVPNAASEIVPNAATFVAPPSGEAYVSPYSTGPTEDSVADTAPAAVISSAPPPAAEIEEAEFEERPYKGGRPSTPPPAYYDDDEDIPGLPGRGGSPLRWMMLIVIVGGLALMFSQWERVARLVGIGGDPAAIAASIEDGDSSLELGDSSAYASAIEAYGRAIEAGGEGDPELLGKLSNAYALAAQAQIDDGASQDSIGNLTAAALTTAETATERDPRNLEAKLAMADALRLNGQVADARRVLEGARAMSFSRTAEFFRIDSRLSAAEAGGKLEAGLRSAKQAVELSPDGVPYLLLLARAQAAAGEGSRAEESLNRILVAHPEHPVAVKLMGELRAAETAAGPDAEALVDAGVGADAGAEAEPETATEAAVGTKPAVDGETTPAPEKAAVDTKDAAEEAVPVSPSAAEKSKAPRKTSPARKPVYDEYDRLAEAAGSDAFVDGRPPIRGYDWYMRQGRAELGAGTYSRARAYFDSALEAHPGSAEAMDGLGKVLTGMEDYNGALRYFRVAAQRGQPDGYFNLGRTYERLGRKDEAVSAYYTYVKRRPDGPHAAVAVSAIKRLEPRAKLPAVLEQKPSPEPAPVATPEPESEPSTP
ncbi:MAG: tetratricopeptide repeat protein [Polyangiales bacterium]